MPCATLKHLEKPYYVNRRCFRYSIYPIRPPRTRYCLVDSFDADFDDLDLDDEVTECDDHNLRDNNSQHLAVITILPKLWLQVPGTCVKINVLEDYSLLRDGLRMTKNAVKNIAKEFVIEHLSIVLDWGLCYSIAIRLPMAGGSPSLHLQEHLHQALP